MTLLSDKRLFRVNSHFYWSKHCISARVILIVIKLINFLSPKSQLMPTPGAVLSISTLWWWIASSWLNVRNSYQEFTSSCSSMDVCCSPRRTGQWRHPNAKSPLCTPNSSANFSFLPPLWHIVIAKSTVVTLMPTFHFFYICYVPTTSVSS